MRFVVKFRVVRMRQHEMQYVEKKLDRSQIETIVYSAVADLGGLNADDLSGDFSLTEDIDLDSVDILDLSFEIEKRIGKDLRLVDLLRLAKKGSLDHRSIDLSQVIDFIEAESRKEG
ncbi:MAG: hypothetical protein KDD61_05260 [Bdellovibrionales bacterium]|nr:hypothetical protein [Bdellovibrionales bacterium]